MLIGAPAKDPRALDSLVEMGDDETTGELVNKIAADNDDSECEEEKGDEEELDEDGKPVNEEFLNCIKDHKFFEKIFKDDISKFNQLKIVPKKVYLKENTTKYDILELISKASINALEQKVDVIKICYSGHGCHGTGNWSILRPPIYQDESEYEITLQEVIEHVQDTGYKNTLNIMHDGCYSGKWSYKCQELNDKGIIKLERVYMTSSCGPDTKA